jgi:Ca-activated chloride channel family protein
MTIRETVAEKKLRMVFEHNGTAQTEAVYFLELEPDQKVDGFRVKIGGKPAEAELLSSDKAKKIYEEIVSKRKDPALLEYYGYQLLRIRLFPIPPKSTFEVEIETVEPLRADGGLVRVNTLNAAPSSVVRPLAAMTVEATITSAHAIKSVFSPTHAVDVVRKNEREARLTYAKKDYVPTGPFTFYYSLDDRDIGATLLAFAEPGEDGAFMLTITPPVDGERLPRDVVFCVDTSGSMAENGKIDQVKTALKRVIDTLTDRDRFNVVTFATEADDWRNELADATADRRTRAKAWIDREMRARGGTNVEAGLSLALGHRFRDEATKIVVLLSDGNPTIGERDTLKLVAGATGKGVRLFTFGVGFDVNTQLLDRLAIANGGDRQYIHPNEDASLVLEGFAQKIDAPLVASPALAFGEGVTEVYPKRLPDIFRGGSLVVFGRVKGDQPRRVELTGNAGGKRVSRTYEVRFGSDPRHAFVPRLWAIQKIDFLLDEIRARGAAKELVDHIVELSKKYAVVTPYTAFLMTEDTPTAAAARQLDANLRRSQGSNFTGEYDWNQSRNAQSWRGAYNNEAQVLAQNEALGRGQSAKAVQQTLAQNRVVGNRAYYNRGAAWTEASYAAQNARAIKFASDEYFAFLRANPSAAQAMALGTNVTFRHNDEWIRVE